MKTLKLTKYECDVIRDCLFSNSLCKRSCYCDYKTDMCEQCNDDGTYKCKFQRTIYDILEKLKG